MGEPHAARIGIALSGGGSRAIAFHLGCLRALDRSGLLQRTRVLSTVSGGSVIGALYMLHDGPFDGFEARVRQVLRQGLVGLAIKTAVSSTEGLKAIACVLMLHGSGLLRFLWPFIRKGRASPRLRRFASRTTILELAMHRHLFAETGLKETAREGKPRWIALATELRTGSAFYFSASGAASWRFGAVQAENLSIAHAVVASAAYPLMLPALDEILDFTTKTGITYSERVSLTDGGVYDNLGISPLWPDRSSAVSFHVDDVDTIIACRAGDGLRLDEPNLFLPGRMMAAVAAMHGRAQNATMKRLFDLKESGRLANFILPYLGQEDGNLAFPPSNLISRAEVLNYPTNFSPMSNEWIERLSLRGDQLTTALIREHLQTT
jgi:NTE family protein